jgi:1-phosphofructokinase family hexose kinase
MITVAGLSPSLDLTYRVGRLRHGEIHRPDELVRVAGGKPLNLARTARTLGAEVRVVAVLGGPTGLLLHRALADEGVAVRVVTTPEETRICVSIADDATAALTELYPYAAPLPAPVWQRVQAVLAADLTARPGWLVLSGGAPRGSSPDTLARLVALGRQAGVRVAVDSHGAELPAAVAAGPTLVKINRYEAAELLGQPADSDLAAMAEALLSADTTLVVITDGPAGALARTPETAYRIRLPEVAGRFPVGSGDAFLGGLLAALDTAVPLPQALVTAAAAGTANALVPGPGRFSTATLAALQAQVRLEEVRPRAAGGGPAPRRGASGG